MSEELWDIANLLLVAVLTIGLPPILTVMVSQMKAVGSALEDKLRQDMGDKNYDFARKIMLDAVMAAEQNGATGKIAELGEAKKKFALAAAQKALDDNGIYIDLNTLDTILEAAVNDAFGS